MGAGSFALGMCARSIAARSSRRRKISRSWASAHPSITMVLECTLFPHPSRVDARADSELAQTCRDPAKAIGAALTETHSGPDYVP